MDENRATPPSDPLITENDFWIEVSKAEVTKPQPEYIAGSAIAKTDVTIRRNKRVYRLTVDAEDTPFESTDFDQEFADGKWEYIGEDTTPEAVTGAGPYTADMKSRMQAKFTHEAAVSFSLLITHGPVGGSGLLFLKKTTAADITITFPATARMLADVQGWNAGSQELTISGAINSYFQISWELWLDGETAVVILSLNSLSLAPESVYRGASAVTSGDGSDTGQVIQRKPKLRYEIVISNQVRDIGYGEKTRDLYITGDDGVTAREFTDIQAGDKIFWNGVVAGAELDGDDTIIQKSI